MKIATILTALAIVIVTAPPVDADQYEKIHSVAIVSTIGDRLSLQTIGEIPLAGENKDMQVADWGINDWIARTLTQSLSKRFEVKTAPIDMDAVTKCGTGKTCNDIVPHNSGVDALIVVNKANAPIGNQQSSLFPAEGLGLYFKKVIFSRYNCTVYANYVVYVVDANTGEVLGEGQPHLPGKNFFGERYGSALMLTSNDWPNEWGQMTDAQRDTLKKLIAELVTQTFPVAIEIAGLPTLSAPLPPLTLTSPPH